MGLEYGAARHQRQPGGHRHASAWNPGLKGATMLVQMSIVAMDSINAIVDGVVAARFIDAATVGVVGLYYAMLRVLVASGSILPGGMTVLSGRYLGSGKIDRTRGIRSLAMLCALLIGIALTALSFFMPGTLAG